MEGTMSEIRLFAGDFQPKYWAYCDGRLLSIATNSALFSLLGTVYGGNGQTTFALPDLRSRVAVGTGQGPGLSNMTLGEMSGTPNVTLTQLNLPAHNHPASCSISIPTYSEPGTSSDPNGSILASTNGLYKTGVAADSALTQNGASVVVTPAGGSQPMNIEQPYLAMNYIICTMGIYPSRN